jgi:hypothetical protein
MVYGIVGFVLSYVQRYRTPCFQDRTAWPSCATYSQPPVYPRGRIPFFVYRTHPTESVLIVSLLCYKAF